MAVTTGTAKVTLPTDEQILITREFDAPKHLVYKAWTTPELVMRWWAGKRGTMQSVEIDLKVGGMWRYVMAGDGYEVAFHGTFREIVPDERIVTTEIFEMPDGEQQESDPVLNIVSFVEDAGRTTLSLLVDAPSKDIRDLIVNSGMEVGMQEQMDLLEALAVSLA
jgi:uncharacterized protein YndB with AHSA1/START domain